MNEYIFDDVSSNDILVTVVPSPSPEPEELIAEIVVDPSVEAILEEVQIVSACMRVFIVVLVLLAVYKLFKAFF